jgi:hypothetical protein
MSIGAQLAVSPRVDALQLPRARSIGPIGLLPGNLMRTILITAALAFFGSAPAADYQPLQGSYKVGGKTLIDPPASEAQDTHFYLDLEGAAARDLYKAIKAKAQDGVCGEPGDSTKRLNDVQCTMVKGGKEYHCAFGVELRTQRIVSGVVC